MDAIYGAGIDAGGVFGPDAGFGNDIGHGHLPLSEPTVFLFERTFKRLHSPGLVAGFGRTASNAGGHATPLKFASTWMPHSSSSHSGMYSRFLFCSHQVRSSTDEAYISAVSCSCLTRSSNSVASAGASRVGRPQLGFPRLRVKAGRATGMAMARTILRLGWPTISLVAAFL